MNNQYTKKVLAVIGLFLATASITTGLIVLAGWDDEDESTWQGPVAFMIGVFAGGMYSGRILTRWNQQQKESKVKRIV